MNSHFIWENQHIKWIDWSNPSKEDLASLSKEYRINHHVMADSMEPNHLPKKEQLRNMTFIILRLYDKKTNKYPSTVQDMSNKLAIFYDRKNLITIHRNPLPLVKEVKTKYFDTGIKTEANEIITMLMWYVIKSYEDSSLRLSEDIDVMERNIFLGKQNGITLEELYYLKNSARLNRKLLKQMSDVINQYVTIESDNSALHDVKDLILKFTHSFEETYDDATNLSNIYLSIMSKKTNDAIKLLTIFSVFFMPLTFIVGIYGMNFKYMPELELKSGYPLVLGVMLVISIIIMIWFKRKNIL